jgi:hypothetical protein
LEISGLELDDEQENFRNEDDENNFCSFLMMIMMIRKSIKEKNEL